MSPFSAMILLFPIVSGCLDFNSCDTCTTNRCLWAGHLNDDQNIVQTCHGDILLDSAFIITQPSFCTSAFENSTLIPRSDCTWHQHTGVVIVVCVGAPISLAIVLAGFYMFGNWRTGRFRSLTTQPGSTSLYIRERIRAVDDVVYEEVKKRKSQSQHDNVSLGNEVDIVQEPQPLSVRSKLIETVIDVHAGETAVGNEKGSDMTQCSIVQREQNILHPIKNLPPKKPMRQFTPQDMPSQVPENSVNLPNTLQVQANRPTLEPSKLKYGQRKAGSRIPTQVSKVSQIPISSKLNSNPVVGRQMANPPVFRGTWNARIEKS